MSERRDYMQKIKKNWKRIVLGLTVLILSIVAGLFIYIRFNTYEAMEEAKAILSEENVSQENGLIKVEPEDSIGNIVFYQGAFVETEAYLPLAKRLSEEGFRVFIPNMPLNLAILDINVFETIYENYASDDEWWLGGHSLGGASASIYVADQNKNIDGVFFLASYPSGSSDLSDRTFPVLSITATDDTIINEDRFNESTVNLPDHTVYKSIEGGNHSSFGYYGFQSGDGTSLITREEQHEETVSSIMSLYNNSR